MGFHAWQGQNGPEQPQDSAIRHWKRQTQIGMVNYFYIGVFQKSNSAL